MGLTWIMPNGADAPGKVLPSSWVPMKVLTGMSCTACTAGTAAREAAMGSTQASSVACKACNLVKVIMRSPGFELISLPLLRDSLQQLQLLQVQRRAVVEAQAVLSTGAGRGNAEGPQLPLPVDALAAPPVDYFQPPFPPLPSRVQPRAAGGTLPLVIV